MAHLGAARRPGAGGPLECAWAGVARAARGTTERPSPARWPGTSERATGVPGPEGAPRGGSGQGASRLALEPPRLHPSTRAWERPVLGPGRWSPRRRVLLLFGRRTQSPNHLHLHLPPLCLNATPGRGPGEGRRGFPGLAPLGTCARGHTGWTRGYAVGAGSNAQIACSPPRPGAAQQPSAPTPNSRSGHWGRWAGRTPPGPAPRPPRPAHALHDLGAGRYLKTCNMEGMTRGLGNSDSKPEE
uniref:cuticle collagen 13-like n=1 Tax=Halichoerus grypus TaxID=9711 RepID=UPI0016597C36|nr:cuticle collagen 13-like [Halichoerus grypus]